MNYSESRLFHGGDTYLKIGVNEIYANGFSMRRYECLGREKIYDEANPALSQETQAMKRSIQRWFISLLAFIFTMSVSCAAPPPKPPKAVKTVVFITNTTSKFRDIAQKGCENADAELPDVTVTFETTNTTTTEDRPNPNVPHTQLRIRAAR